MLAFATGPSTFDRQVTLCMQTAPAVVRRETPLADLVRALEATPALAIVDELENLVGVVSRTDLVALGIHRIGRSASATMKLPALSAGDVMTSNVVTVPCTATIRAAAQAMAAHAIHRVYVTDHRLLLGVITAMDIARAVRDARVGAELSTIMTSPPIMVGTTTSLGAAVELLSRVRVSGLVVLEDDRPVGTFTHVEALASRDVPRSTSIDELYEPAVLCLPATTALHSVAAHLVRLDTQRVIACTAREVVGIATTLDFVRYVAW
jgi:CBS domain-containing protein